MAKKGSKQKDSERKIREYNERRRRMDALENGSGGIRKRSEDWD
jgi:hypothetical protein